MSSLYRASFIKTPMISNGTFFIHCCDNDVFLCKELFESKALFGQREFSWWADSCVTSCTSVFIVSILVTYCSVCTVWLFAILLATETTCLSFFFVKLIPPATIYSAETVALPRDSIEFLVWRRDKASADRPWIESSFNDHVFHCVAHDVYLFWRTFLCSIDWANLTSFISFQQETSRILQ